MASISTQLAAFKNAVLDSAPIPSALSSSLSSLKLTLASSGLIPPFPSSSLASPAFASSGALAREFFEFCCFYSIRQHDLPGFFRHFSQLRAFYFDYSHVFQPSPHQSELLGLYLLALLASNKISEFHTELELIANPVSAAPAASDEPKLIRSISSSNTLISSAALQFPIELEKQLMEGCFNQVLQSRSAAPSPRFEYFLGILSSTVRDKIAECAEAAFVNFPVEELAKMLRFNSQEETKRFMEKRGWDKKIVNGRVDFSVESAAGSSSATDGLAEVNRRVIQEALKYATEIEKIV